MPITINVAGQVGQIRLGHSKALWPLFETVVNSIQSLEDTETNDKEITIEANRSTDVQFRINSKGEKEEEPVHFEEFIVTDNGNGFNEDNYKSFLEAYSQLKVKKGCKGIGRFLWLKAFDLVSIHSTYMENGKWYNRSFDFSISGVSSEDNVRVLDGNNHTRKTSVYLKRFKAEYRDSVGYKLESLGRKIIEHCLPYFIMGNIPKITLKDNRDEKMSLNDYYRDVYKDNLHQDPMQLRDREYTLYHMLLESGTDKHELHLCANNREVKPIDLSKHIPNLQKRIDIEGSSFYYVGYLSGDYLDETINSERSEFDFSDLPVLGEHKGANEEEIVNKAVELVKAYLQDDLSKIGDEKRKQIDFLVHSKKPQYRILLNNRPDVYDEIPVGLSEDKLDVELYKQQQKWELEVAQQRNSIEERIRKDATSDSGFKELFEEYCQNITDLGRAGLAEYVARRKAVIDLLGKALEMGDDGKYSKESRIHSIICPMQTTSDEIPFDDMNLWLIDDRLAYHHYLASDKKISGMGPLENKVSKRTDITVFDAALSFTTNKEDISSITIVELKRPERDDTDNNPVQQALHYVEDIKSGKIKRYNGREIGNVDNVAFYCYVIGDLTESMKRSAKDSGLILTQDRTGYFGFVPSYGAYVEVISYDKLLKDAKQKNEVLFDKLFSPKAKDLSFKIDDAK
ncbi:MAG: hypothetical protein BACD_00117 [Bacteroides rodentium]